MAQPSDKVVCISSTHSPTFKIFCRRRSRPIEDDEDGVSRTAQSNIQGHSNVITQPHPPSSPGQKDLRVDQHYLPNLPLGSINPLVGSRAQSRVQNLQPTFSRTDLGQFSQQISMPMGGPYLNPEQLLQTQYPGSLGGIHPGFLQGVHPTYASSIPHREQALDTLVSALVKLEMLETGKLHAIARVSDMLHNEILELVNENKKLRGVLSNGRQVTDLFYIVAQHLGLGVRIDASKLHLANNFATYLCRSERFLSTISEIKQSFPKDKCLHLFLSAVNDCLAGFLKSMGIPIQSFFAQFCPASNYVQSGFSSAPSMPLYRLREVQNQAFSNAPEGLPYETFQIAQGAPMVQAEEKAILKPAKRSFTKELKGSGMERQRLSPKKRRTAKDGTSKQDETHRKTT